MHNENNSDEAKQEAENKLKQMSKDQGKDSAGKEDKEKNPNNVAGGLKACVCLSSPRSDLNVC